MPYLTQLPEWLALGQHYRQIANVRMADLFAADAKRFEKFSLEFEGILFDYSKNRITNDTLTLLVKLAEKINLADKIAALTQGRIVNNTEQRPALHTALRAEKSAEIVINNENIIPQVHRVLEQMENLVAQVSSGAFKGCTGEAITDVVNIGIGGSNLGPLMVTQALKPYAASPLKLHFLSNIHQGNLEEIIHQLNPARTLFIISTKSYSTIETLVNAASIQQWFAQTHPNPQAFLQQVVAVTANKARARAAGIPEAHIFEFWDWVGGRYSLWSAIGLPIALAIGMQNFRALLAGARAVDGHFVSAPFRQNIPVLMGLLGIWYHNFFNTASHAVIPYNYYLRALPAYLQQLDMESNGKRITQQGESVDYPTGPVLWGEMGTDGQHAFHQLLHQGTPLIAADFIIELNNQGRYQNHQDILVASCLGQTRALMHGISYDEVYAELIAKGYSEEDAKKLAPHKVYPGNRPSNTLALKQLSPYSLGALLALYEHKIFVQGAIWGINSFDQWGVELGKVITQQLLDDFTQQAPSKQLDASTKGLMHYYFA